MKWHVADGVQNLDERILGTDVLAAYRNVAVRPRGQTAEVIAARTRGELQPRERELAVIRRRLVDRRVDGSAEPSAALREHTGGGCEDEEKCESGDDRTAHRGLRGGSDHLRRSFSGGRR